MSEQAVVLIISSNYNEFLLQLRYFIPSIHYPGHWGGFGGSLEKDEGIVAAVYGELEEELNFRPSFIHDFKSYHIDGQIIHACYCNLNCFLSELELSEGIEMGMLSQLNILHNNLHS